LLHEQNRSISKWTGLFLDKPLERQFQQSYLKLHKDYLRRIIFILGIVYFSFFVYDLISIRESSIVIILFICRMILFVLSCVFYLKSEYFLKSWAFQKITTYELLFLISFFTIIMMYEHPNFLFHILTINIIILGIFFFVPNLLLNKVLVSITLLICFLGVAVAKFHLPVLEIIYSFGYVTLAIVFSLMRSYTQDKNMRLDFVNQQCLIEHSMKDPLTNTYNRLKFNESLVSQIVQAKRFENTFSLIMFDVDHFKKVNDINGHMFGDQVLIKISDIVKACIREVDIFARWGGEEFVILLPQTNCTEASVLAERLRKTIWKESSKINIVLTCSFGVTSFSNDDEHSIMERVDRALYRAKKSGRNVVVSECAFRTLSS